MSGVIHEKHSRRDFLKGVGRYLILGGLVSMTGVMVARRKSASAEKESLDISVCQKCIFLRRCEQPSALLAREEMTG